VDPKDYTLRHSDYENIHKYHFASDFAIISVPQGPSKKFISNIKVGEYLTAGLPFLINKTGYLKITSMLQRRELEL